MKDVLTVEQVYEEFQRRHLKAKLKSWQEIDRAIVKDFISRYAKRDLQSITKLDLVRVTDRVSARGALIHANRLQQYVQRFFNWCVAMDYLAHTPFVGMPKPSNERSRDRVLSLDELRKIYKAACNLDDVHAGFVRLLILTGQRRSEIAHLKWQEIQQTPR